MPSLTIQEQHKANVRAAELFREAWAREGANDFDGAFALYDEANRWGRLRYGYSVPAGDRNFTPPDQFAARHAAAVENLSWLYPPKVFEQSGPGHPSGAPIFIVGLPRSGSTLIEQLLATHSQVQGMGETAAFSRIARRSYPAAVAQLPAPNYGKAMGADYLDAIEAEGWTRRLKPRFTDKLLDNYMYLGSIQLALPHAVILHAVREPIDLCLSCYRGDFGDNNETQYCYDLAEIGAHYVRYRRAMDYWRSVLPRGRIIDVEHEGLVANFEDEARRLLRLCGLRWEDQVLRFYENPREVATMSKEQVKQPVFTGSIGRWRSYEKHLGPLVKALGPYAPSGSARE